MKFGQAYLLLLSAIFAVASVAAEEVNGGCVVDPGVALAEREPAGVLALAPALGDKPVRLSFGCRDGSVSSLQVRSVPGQAVEARFLLVSRPGAVADLDWDATTTASGWSRLESGPAAEGSILVTLRIDVPDSAVPGTVQSGQLRFRSEESGQAESFSLPIPLMIEIIEPGPLFRDHFNHTPPSIGQFSMVY